MRNTVRLAIALACLLMVASAASAHQGHQHGPPSHAQGQQGHGASDEAPRGNGSQAQQGPPEHANSTGRPEHAGEGPPDHANSTGRPDHAADGPPGHTNGTGQDAASQAPAHARNGSRPATHAESGGAPPEAPPGQAQAPRRADDPEASAPAQAGRSGSAPSTTQGGDGPDVHGSSQDTLERGPNVAPVPRENPLLESVAGLPYGAYLTWILTSLALGAAVAVFGTVRMVRPRQRSGPYAVTRAEREALRAHVAEATAAGLDAWRWHDPETYEALQTLHADTVAFWTDSDAADVARWQGQQVGEKGEEVPMGPTITRPDRVRAAAEP